MIKYNSNTINDWNFGDDNIIKVYRNNAVCYYKVTSGDTPTPVQEPCFAVVDDISQYSDTEFVDVYNKADGKWYKLNNLFQYEEYGVYGSGRNVTTYEGKLTIDDEASSRLPQGYTEVEYIENTGTSYINTDLQIYSSTTDSFEVEAKLIAAKHDSQTYQNVFSCMSEDGEPYQGFTYRYQSSSLTSTSIPNGENTFTIVNNEDSSQTVTVTSSTSQRTYTHTYPLTLFCGLNSSRSPFRWTNSKFYYFKVKMNDELVRDLVPCKRDSDDKYGMYDIVNDVFYLSPNNVDFVGGELVIEPTKTYEYEWNGSSWVNLGEVSGSSRVPIGYTEVEYIENTGTSYLDIAFKPNTNTRILTEMQAVSSSNYPRLFGAGMWNSATGINLVYQTDGGSNCLHINWYGRTSWSYYTSFTFDYDKHTYDLNKNSLYRDETLVGSTSYTTSYQSTDNLGVFTYISGGRPSSSSYWGQEHFKGKMYSFKVYDNGTLVRDLVPCIRDNDNTVGAYDIVNDVFYTVPSGYTTDKLIAGAETGTTECPKYYDEMQDPPNNVSFSSMTEAEAYECPWVGMQATIDGVNYVFSGDSTSGYEWVEKSSRLPQGYTEVEYIQNTGTSYINTNFLVNQDTRIVTEMQTVTSTSYGRFVGAGGYDKTNAVQFDYETGANGTLHVSWGAVASWTTYSNCTGDYNRHIYDWDKNYFYRDKGETNQFSASTTYTSFQCTDNLGVFCNILNSTAENYMKGKMYSFQLYDNDTLIRDLVPCTRDSDSKAGAYDVVNDVFYVSPNGNNFIAGPSV